ncbi:hypothetical protein ABZ154_15420 [Streptomyces sp. NPDC006261]|uniref:hypothetical protein n=1 Tax=Streptomyces sp. NPDC006261 TaxID=3156739 RepID=UPI0033BAC3B7
MGVFRKSPAEKQAIADMKAADRALNNNTDRESKAGIFDETPDYQRLNGAANDAASKVSRWHGGTRK